MSDIVNNSLDVDEMPDVVDDIPAVGNQTQFSVEKAMVCTGADDNTLLDLVGRASPYPAIEFIKEVRSFSQATLDVALILACQRGFIFLVQRLLTLSADIECRDASGKTPLLICVENHYFDLVRFLVDRRADVKAVDHAGNNALILSISSEGSTKMLQFLLGKAGIMINHQNNDGYTAVMKALEIMNVRSLVPLLKTYFCENCSEQPSSSSDSNCSLLESSVGDSNCSLLDSSEGDSNCSLLDSSEGNSNWALLDQTVNCKGETAQHIAEKHGLGAMLKCLKECISEGTSPIQAAVEARDLETLDFLLISKMAPENDINDAFLSMFLQHFDDMKYPIPKEMLSITKRLLECGADFNKLLSISQTLPVEIAIFTGDFDLIELLCKHGAPLNKQMYGSDEVPLCLPAQNGRMDIMKLLLKYNADVNTPSYRNSPLHSALIHGHTDCARFLVNHGANMDISLALSCIIEKQDPEYLKFLLQNYENETISCLLEDGKNGNTFLLEAVKGGNLEIIEQILQAGVGVNSPQPSGATPIVESKNGAVALLLIRYGADVNHVTDITNETPLMHVLKRLSHYRPDSDKEEVFWALLENGASVHARSRYGITPLMLAARHGHEVILKKFLLLGADCSDQDNDGNTALLHAILGFSYIHHHKQKFICCIEALLDNSTNASFLCPRVLPTVITISSHDIIPIVHKFIRYGFGPVDLNIPLQVYQGENLFPLSPLCLALLVENVSLARYFWKIMFMTISDLYLSSYTVLRCTLRRKKTKKSKECLSFLDEFSSQPMSLFKMSFVVVTSAVGASPGREARISKLPLPWLVKDMLLFKSDDESLTKSFF
ncbi:hypothetical protein BsWGS_25677 [Bradybaena similaris]